ncbi:MAG TPA: glycosyltransferase family 4 protein [Candidatus Binatus sp.]|nr:glycosyltransferase family 4 protein [Candidatus Binatus sp.]
MKRALVVLGQSQHAGMLRAVKLLADAGPRHGWELTFVLAAPNSVVEASGLPGERITYLPGLRGWRRWSARLALPATVLRLARCARGADLLYACTLSSFPHCLLAGRLVGRPQVAHVYSSYETASPYRKHLLARARHVVAPSADSLALAERALGGFRAGTRAHVVYNGMNVAALARAADGPAPATLQPDGLPRVGMVGNLDPRKNPPVLLEAAARVRRTLGRLRVVLIGAFRDAAYETEVRAGIARLGLQDAVTTTGFLPNPFPAVRTLDILAHPALRDPFPLALLEGMALARPIVASAVGGIPEMIADGESGILVPPRDADALAQALLALLGDPARRARMGAAAHDRLATRFSPERFAAGMFDVFEQALADGRG